MKFLFEGASAGVELGDAQKLRVNASHRPKLLALHGLQGSSDTDALALERACNLCDPGEKDWLAPPCGDCRSSCRTSVARERCTDGRFCGDANMRRLIDRLRGIPARDGVPVNLAGDDPAQEDCPATPAEAQCEHDPAALEDLAVEDLPDCADLDATSDYRPFLRKTVSAEMKRAGLRRAWASDPAIASFKGFADYDWDANAVGYGWLRPADAGLAAATLLGQAERRPEEEEKDDIVTAEVELEAPDKTEQPQEDVPLTSGVQSKA